MTAQRNPSERHKAEIDLWVKLRRLHPEGDTAKLAVRFDLKVPDEALQDAIQQAYERGTR